MPVPTLCARAGGDHVSHACETRECLDFTPQSNAQSAHFGEPAGNQGGTRIIAGSQAITHADCNGDDVFQNAPQLAANHVLIGVDAEKAAIQHRLQREGGFVLLKRQNTGRSLPGDNFASEIGTRQDPRDTPGRQVANDFSHPHPATLFEPFAQTDDGYALG